MIRKSLIAALAAVVVLSAGAASAAVPPTGWEQKPFAAVQMAAEAGDGKAQWELGKRYYYDKATKDDVKALQWFEKAAKQGVPIAEYETATMYELGEGTAKDPKMAMYWYKKSAADGVEYAYADIGIMYMDGDGVDKDAAEAVRWYQKGADLGEKRAEALLGRAYRDGTGVAQDPVKALLWLKAAVKQKQIDAATMLEDMYRDGKGVPADPVTAHAWRTMAYYLKNQAAITRAGNGEYAMLSTPNLSVDDNVKAWLIYKAFMLELGFAKPDKPGPDGSTPESAARDYFKDAANRSLQAPFKP